MLDVVIELLKSEFSCKKPEEIDDDSDNPVFSHCWNCLLKTDHILGTTKIEFYIGSYHIWHEGWKPIINDYRITSWIIIHRNILIFPNEIGLAKKLSKKLDIPVNIGNEHEQQSIRMKAYREENDYIEINKHYDKNGDEECPATIDIVKWFKGESDENYIVEDIKKKFKDIWPIVRADIITLSQNDMNKVLAGEEGGKKMVYHLLAERNKRNAKLFKQYFRLKNDGNLFCQCCNFNFEDIYPKYGEDYGECHHKIPLSQYAKPSKPDIENDYNLLCANCHRMIHRVILKENKYGDEAVNILKKSIKKTHK